MSEDLRKNRVMLDEIENHILLFGKEPTIQDLKEIFEVKYNEKKLVQGSDLKETERDFKATSEFLNNFNQEDYGKLINIAKNHIEISRACKNSNLPEPVKNLELDKSILENVKKIISKYIDTTPQNVEILALWLLGTYFHSEFETYPILQLLAQKRSGKTRTLKLLSSLSYKSDGSVSTSPTETHLFRHKEGALFFDEMENIGSKERGAFRETLNAVYKRGNKIPRYREVKKDGVKDFEEVFFYPYYPIGLANISGINDVLSDRAVQIILKRSNKELTKLIEDFQTNKEILNLKEKLSHLKPKIPFGFFGDWNNYIENNKLENEDLKFLFDKIKNTGIYGRALEIFFPLVVISYLCDNVDNFLINIKEQIEKREEEDLSEDMDERLKQFINSKTEEYKGFVSVTKITNDFRESLENPENWINVKWLGKALKRLDLIKQKRLINGKVQVILNINSTNTTNSINSINSTNSTKKEVDNVDLSEFIDKKEPKGVLEE